MKTNIILTIIALVLGFLGGRFSLNKISKQISSKTIQTKTIQNKQVITQATTQKDSNLGQRTSYTEKSFNKKGILIHEISYGNQMVASTDKTMKEHIVDVNNNISTSESKNTLITDYQSNWFIGLNVLTQDLKQPTNLEKEPQDINFMLEFRPFSQFYLFAETNYKLDSRIGFLIPI